MVRAFSDIIQAIRSEGFEPRWTQDTIEFDGFTVVFRNDASISGFSAVNLSWGLDQSGNQELALRFARIIVNQSLSDIGLELADFLDGSPHEAEIERRIVGWKMTIRRNEFRAQMNLKRNS